MTETDVVKVAARLATEVVYHPMFFHKNDEIKLNRYQIVRDLLAADPGFRAAVEALEWCDTRLLLYEGAGHEYQHVASRALKLLLHGPADPDAKENPDAD